MDSDANTRPRYTSNPDPIGAEHAFTTASPPFDGPDGDIILQTSNCRFWALKAILRFSPIFADMLALPQTVNREEEPGSPPIVVISESSATLDLLLRLMYPMKAPSLVQKDVSLIGDLYVAARKYEIQFIVELAREALREIATTSREKAIGAYAIACHLKLEEEARAAATACLEWPFPGPPVPQLGMMSVLDYHNLLDFHRRVADTMASTFATFPYDFGAATCSKIEAHTHYSCIWGQDKKYLRRIFSQPALVDAVRNAPLDLEKLSLSLFNLKFEENAACATCTAPIYQGWEPTRNNIAMYMTRNADKLCLASIRILSALINVSFMPHMQAELAFSWK